MRPGDLPRIKRLMDNSPEVRQAVEEAAPSDYNLYLLAKYNRPPRPSIRARLGALLRRLFYRSS